MARLVQAAARQLRISPNEIKQLDLKRRSVDARKKNDVRIIYTVDVAVKGREDKILKMAHCARASLAQDPVYHVPQPRSIPAQRPVIVGFGPAGMFAALVLSMAGLRPLVLERGQDAQDAARQGRAGILEDRDAGPGVQRAVRRGRRGDVLRREAEHRRQKRAHRLDPRAVCRGGCERRYPLRRQAAHRHGRAGDGRAESARDDHPLRRRGPLRREGHGTRDARMAASPACARRRAAKRPSSPPPACCSPSGTAPATPSRRCTRRACRWSRSRFPWACASSIRSGMVNESQYGPFADAPGLGAADYKLNVRLPDGILGLYVLHVPGRVRRRGGLGGRRRGDERHVRPRAGRRERERGPARDAEPGGFPGPIAAWRHVLAAAAGADGLPRGRRAITAPRRSSSAIFWRSGRRRRSAACSRRTAPA